MLVNEYAQKVISERQYKYQTRQSYLKGIKAIGIWDMEVSSLSPQLFYEKLDSIPNLNTRRSITIVCKSVFKDLGICKDLKIIDGIPILEAYACLISCTILDSIWKFWVNFE